MATIDLDEVRWLIGTEAERLLAETAASAESLVVQTARLRKTLSAARTHLLLEQVELRERARAKFSQAERMFFTRRGLEQATDELVARYKASRFPADVPVLDLCSGIGGDLIALAARGPARGVDRDTVMGLLAEANARACLESAHDRSAKVTVEDVSSLEVQDAPWHLDPDRRPQGRRTTRVELHEPGADVIDRLRDESPDAAIKLAPAATLPEDWPAEAELEWISRGRECRQLVAWFGRLARHTGRRSATILSSHGVRTLWDRLDAQLEIAASIGRYVFEPDAAVLAADLTSALADEHRLRAIAPRVAYLTGDEPLDDLALAAFEVLDVLPFRVATIKTWLRERGIARVEVKKRGLDVDPERLRKQLAGPGDGEVTLLIAPLAVGVSAIVAKRLAREST